MTFVTFALAVAYATQHSPGFFEVLPCGYTPEEAKQQFSIYTRQGQNFSDATIENTRQIVVTHDDGITEWVGDITHRDGIGYIVGYGA